jgi:polyferredoxin
MVTDEKIYSAALTRFRLGSVLIWLGVLTWLPFIVLRIAGEKPSLFWYLPFHLVGVLGGSRIRSLARGELGLAVPNKNAMRTAGHSLIFLGILVWLPYFYLKLIVQQPVDVMDFLPFHLTGVLGGIGLLLLNYLVGRWKK